MSYPVTQLISESFYTSGIVSRGFQTVAGDQVEVGLLKLNEILSDTAIENDMIPYFTTAYDFPAVPGQELYFIPNLAELETLVFFIDTVRYQMRKVNQDRYFGEGRAQNVESLPFHWHSERCFGGTNIFIYFFPDQQYPMQATGRFRLNNVVLGSDLNSALAVANLGVPIVLGAGSFSAGQLVVNGVDLAGTYATTIALVNKINTGIIPNVTASIATGQFILTNISGFNITVATSGDELTTNAYTFSNFSTTNGALSQTFLPMVLDQYYINYLQYRLAERLCTAYNFNVSDNLRKQLLQYMMMISKKSSPIDLSIGKISTLTEVSSINYAMVNLGHGWVP
jgi:hypothetical protein